MFRIMAHLFVFTVLFAVVLAGNDNAAKKEQKPAEDKQNCPWVRIVNLGIHVVYTDSFVEMRKLKNATENVTEYLSLLVNTTAPQHFGKVSCTNISLVLTGASPLKNSSAVLRKRKDKYLLLDPTLEMFQIYSYHHRKEFGNPDVTILMTTPYIINGSKECNDSYYRGENGSPEYSAYCGFLHGGGYYRGICGNYSVGIVEETGGAFEGQTSLARVLAQLFGSNFDVLRQNETCNDEYTYLLGRSSAHVIYPYLSPCGEDELKNYIDSASNTTLSCWDDNPKPAVAHKFQTPYEFFTEHDFCSRYRLDYFKCPKNQSIPDDFPYQLECTELCCRNNNLFPVDDAYITPYGKKCKNGTGTCYYYKCIQ